MTNKDLKKILDNFSDEVKAGKYQKLDYKLWRELAKIANKDTCAIIFDWWIDDELVIKNDGFRIAIPLDSDFSRYFRANASASVWQDVIEAMDESALAATTATKAYDELVTTASSTALNVPTWDYCLSTVSASTHDIPLTTTGTISTGDWNNYGITTTPIEPYQSTLVINEDVKIKGDLYINGKKFGSKDENEKEGKNMFNFDFGKVTSDNVRMSMYGLAVKNKAGTYVSYDAKSKSVMDVDVLNFDGSDLLYKMPAAISDLHVGDVIIHNRAPMFITGFSHDHTAVIVVDPYAGERKEILPTKSPFGFDFVTRIINLFDGFTNGNAASQDNPFGNMLPLLLLSDKSKSNKDMLPLLMCMNGSMDMNPMMMYLLMGDGDKDSLLPLMMMSMGNKHTCSCGGQCNGSHD